MSKSEVGSIAWVDLTVGNASDVKDFYQSVVGWNTSPVGMGEYEDYSMQTEESHSDVAGICHDRGVNQGLPAQWLIYVKVADLEKSLQKVVEYGGQALTQIKKLSDSSHYAVIQDPAGAVCAIYAEHD